MQTLSRRTLLSGAAALATVGLGARPLGAAAQATPAAPPAALPAESARGFEVLFIRHAESEVNVRLPGPSDPPDEGVTYPLTELGLEQSIARAETLADAPISALYSSTRLRCVQTADAIAARTEELVRLAPELVEITFGTDLGEGEEVLENVLGVWQQWVAGDLDARLEGGESLNDVLARFTPFVEAAVAEHANLPQRLVFVSHGGTLGAGLPHVFTNVSPEFALTNSFTNTGVATGVLRDGRLVCTDWQGLPPG